MTRKASGSSIPSNVAGTQLCLNRGCSAIWMGPRRMSHGVECQVSSIKRKAQAAT